MFQIQFGLFCWKFDVSVKYKYIWRHNSFVSAVHMDQVINLALSLINKSVLSARNYWQYRKLLDGIFELYNNFLPKWKLCYSFIKQNTYNWIIKESQWLSKKPLHVYTNQNVNICILLRTYMGKWTADAFYSKSLLFIVNIVFVGFE